jgi:hypothetical protein
MPDWDSTGPWYHGSQQVLDALAEGSSITRNRELARAFSHRPSLVSTSDAGTVKHNGTTPGYLHLVSEDLDPGDIYPHPHPANARRQEWLISRQVKVTLLEPTAVRDSDALSEEDLEDIREKQRKAGTKSLYIPPQESS